MMSVRRWLMLLGMLLALACGQARADTCTVVAPNFSFSEVSSITTSDVYVKGTFRVTCNWTNILTGLVFPNATVCLSIGGGSGNASANVTNPRQLSGGGKLVNYNLYTDTSYSAAKIWGGWTGTDTAANVITFTLNKSDNLVGSLTQDIDVYGKLNADASLSSINVGPDNLNLTSNFAGVAQMRYIFFLTPGLGCALGTTVAMPFTASARLINDCTINIGNLAFPNSSLLSSAVRTTSTLTTRCSLNTPYRVTFSAGTTPGNSISARRMTGGPTSELVTYQISNTLDGPSLGDGSGGTVTIGGTGNGAIQTQTVYGMVPPQSTPTPGDYKDTVVATVSF
jgi:spore coat protein U-like protein